MLIAVIFELNVVAVGGFSSISVILSSTDFAFERSNSAFLINCSTPIAPSTIWIFSTFLNAVSVIALKSVRASVTAAS